MEADALGSLQEDRKKDSLVDNSLIKELFATIGSIWGLHCETIILISLLTKMDNGGYCLLS